MNQDLVGGAMITSCHLTPGPDAPSQHGHLSAVSSGNGETPTNAFPPACLQRGAPPTTTSADAMVTEEAGRLNEGLCSSPSCVEAAFRSLPEPPHPRAHRDQVESRYTMNPTPDESGISADGGRLPGGRSPRTAPITAHSSDGFREAKGLVCVCENQFHFLNFSRTLLNISWSFSQTSSSSWFCSEEQIWDQ